MTIEECYRMLGGDYAEVLRRLTAPSLIRRFIAKFPQDHTLEQLCAAVEAGNRADAFRAAHTLKGLSQNLGFGKLRVSAERLTEALRDATDEIPAQVAVLLQTVKHDCADTVAVIDMYLTSDPSDGTGGRGDIQA